MLALIVSYFVVTVFKVLQTLSTLYNVQLCYIMEVHVDVHVVLSITIRLFVLLCYVMLCYVMLCYVMLCYVMLCYVMLCYVMLCYVMLCYVMLCYVMLCYVMLCYESEPLEFTKESPFRVKYNNII